MLNTPSEQVRALVRHAPRSDHKLAAVVGWACRRITRVLLAGSVLAFPLFGKEAAMTLLFMTVFAWSFRASCPCPRCRRLFVAVGSSCRHCGISFGGALRPPALPD